MHAVPIYEVVVAVVVILQEKGDLDLGIFPLHKA